MQTGRADVVTSLLREMMLRDGLEIALGGRDEESLEPILLFLIRCRIDAWQVVQFYALFLDI